MTALDTDRAFPTRAHVAPAVVFALSVLSLGIYVPVWYLLRRETLNRLAAGVQMSPAPAMSLLALLLADQFGVLSPLAAHNLEGMLMMSGLNGALMLVATVLLLVMRIKALRQIAAACAAHSDGPGPSRLATMVVGEAYLQARLNDLREWPCPRPAEDERLTAAAS